MQRLSTLLVALCLGLAPLLGHGQLIKAVKVTHTLSPEGPYTVGQEVTVTFKATIQPEYYIYSAVPPEGGGNLPTEFKLDAEATGIELVGKLADGKAPKTKFDDIFETDVRYFEKSATFVQKIRITAPSARLVGYLSYQYCKAEACILDKYELELPLTATGPALTPTPSTKQAPAGKTDAVPLDKPSAAEPTADSTAAAQTPAVTPAPTDPFAVNLAYTDVAAQARRGAWGSFLAAFLFGLVALLTPCVYPMIPLTVSIFTKQASSKAAGRRNALIYALSIIIIYVVIGLALTAIFGAETLYRFSSNPWVNLVFFVIIALFGLSFLGWFEITLPSSWANFFDRRTRTETGEAKRGILPILFMAFTLVIVSFSCTGPLVGTVLIDAARGQFFGPALGMLGFSLAFAIPFGLLALFPGWLQNLPKSGGWMNSVKVVLGFLELALALKFLSNADLVLHWGILDREIYLGGWIVLGLLLAMYLLGKLQLPHDFQKVERLPIPRLLLAIGVLWFVVYMIPGLWGAPLKFLSGFLPPVNPDIGVVVQGQKAACDLPANRKYVSVLGEHTPPGYCVFYDLDEGLAYAKTVNKPVFVDFTGHSCVNCRQVESNVWPDPRVRQLLTEEYVMVSLYVDDSTPLDKTLLTPEGNKLRTVGDQWLYFQGKAFNTNAQPYYVLMDAERNVKVPPIAYELDPVAYATYLEAGLKAYGK
ncbi:MAG: cytochrome c biogenesis protein CcdA [Bacteroidia bacterium]|nr:cytochrome c biogenesis protein CcdA [Bacteroidia bacterium]